jgi:hypothetical protein
MRKCYIVAAALVVAVLGGTSSRLRAQVKPTVSLGFGFQSGRQLVRDVQHFPLGPRVGLGLQGPIGGGFDWGVAADAGYYVQDATNRNGFTLPDPAGTDPDRALILGTAALRIETPRVVTTSLFVAAGEAFAITTPRPGDRASPMIEIGLHPKFDARASVRVGVQYFVNRVGETRVQIPISFDIVL